MRNVKQYGSYKTNPFEKQHQTYSAMVYQPDDYTLNQILSLSPKAIRMLLVIASRIDPLTGMSYSPTAELHRIFPDALPNISAAKSELLRANLMVYAKANHSFYVNPKAFAIVRINL
jgi:hypothetical protein